MNVSETVEAISLLLSSEDSGWDNHLGMRKLFTNWVPRLLTVAYKHNQVIISKEFGVVHHNTPKTNKQSE